MNIIYGLIGATVGRASGTKEALIEESLEVQGIFSRCKVQDKHFKEKGYQQFHTKLIRSTEHGVVMYYIRLSNKAKLVLNHNMDMHPKPYLWEVEKSFDIPENTLLITRNQNCGTHSDQCYLKFVDDKSFQRWQRQLGQILAEINCLHAMKPLQSGRLSANKMHQTIQYCRLLLPMSEHGGAPLIDGQYMLTRLNDGSPVERIHLIHWVRRRLSDTIEGLLMRPCHVTAEDISLLHRCAETIRDFDEDPDMLYVVTRLEVRSHYTRHELERICKAIEYEEAAEEAEASRWLWGDAEPGCSINNTLRSSRRSCSGCSNNSEVEFATASAVVVHGSPGSPLSDESASLPIIDESPEPEPGYSTLSHIVPMNMEVRRAPLGRHVIHKAAPAVRSYESLLIDSTKFHSPSVRIGGTRVSAKKVIATMLGSPTIGRAPLQAILVGPPRKLIMPHRLHRSGNLPKLQSDAMLTSGLKDAPSRVYSNENNENDCTNVPDHVSRDTRSSASPELINKDPIAISSSSSSKHSSCSDARRRWSGGTASSTPTLAPSHKRGGWGVLLLASLYSSVIISVVVVWSPRTIITHPELKCAVSFSLQPLVGSEPFLVLSPAAVMDLDYNHTAVMDLDYDDYHHTAVMDDTTTLGSTTAVVSDDPRRPMLSIRDEHMTSESSKREDDDDDDDNLFDEMEPGCRRGMHDRAITDREAIPMQRDVSTGAGAAVDGWIARKDQMKRGEHNHSTRIIQHQHQLPSAVPSRIIRRAVGWLRNALWKGPLCMLRTLGRRLLAMFVSTVNDL